jgi:hypothetical protein
MDNLLSNELPRIFTEEERHNIKDKQAKKDAARDQDVLAKFKIELTVGRGFTPNTPSPGMLAFFENANWRDGDGDSLIHFCPGKKLGVSECEHYIPAPSHGYGFLVCPSCGTAWKGPQVIGQILARLPADKWAELIYKYYIKLDMRCDLVILYPANDIRAAAAAKHNGEALATARSRGKRLKRIYRMSAIIKDTAAGADLLTRIKAFVRA